jgi:hypothetical protein
MYGLRFVSRCVSLLSPEITRNLIQDFLSVSSALKMVFITTILKYCPCGNYILIYKNCISQNITIFWLHSLSILLATFFINSFGYILYHFSTSGHFSTTLTEVFSCFSSVARQMPGYNSQRRGTARNSQIRR